MNAVPAMVVHGGAGTVEDARRAACVAGCERAAEAGGRVLAHGGSALDAVCAAVVVLEDDPEFNAGYGSVLTRMGIVEVDAAVMAYDPLSPRENFAGAVGAVPWMRHPVALARRVAERGEHRFLVGGGALLFARAEGFGPDSPAEMIAPRARAIHEAAQVTTGGTVGACAVDARGRIAAATSTGGTAGKHAGRVGDSPIFGAGTWASAAGAASATGHGEAILVTLATHAVAARLAAGQSATDAVRQTVAEVEARTGVHVGLIAVAANGEVGHFAATARMPWAAWSAGQLHSGAEHP